MVTQLVATGKVERGGAVVITATSLVGGADHPAPPAADAWEKGRAAYFTALYDEGMEFEPAIEDDSFWIRTGC